MLPTVARCLHHCLSECFFLFFFIHLHLVFVYSFYFGKSYYLNETGNHTHICVLSLCHLQHCVGVHEPSHYIAATTLYLFVRLSQSVI